MNYRTYLEKLHKHRFMIAVIVIVVAIVSTVYGFFFSALNRTDETKCVYIDADDTEDSVFNKVQEAAGRKVFGFTVLMRHTDYKDHVRPGRYEIKPGEMVFTVFRRIKNGRQTPLKLTIPCVRTTDRLAGELGKKLMADSLSFLRLLTDEDYCRKFELDTCTIMCLFIPNTYEVYWTVKPEELFERMKRESDAFWTVVRKSKAEALGLTPVEVMTLASIVDEETANNAEKPMIAGMYYNRLQADMPLQADPTIKYARHDFAAKRIYVDWTFIRSPYNTYRNIGLPPGPIRIPSVAGIDAVLNLVHHNYMYMCAKEDFSGTHNFAVTYTEHQKNAKKYSDALNAKGVK